MTGNYAKYFRTWRGAVRPALSAVAGIWWGSTNPPPKPISEDITLAAYHEGNRVDSR